MKRPKHPQRPQHRQQQRQQNPAQPVYHVLDGVSGGVLGTFLSLAKAHDKAAAYKRRGVPAVVEREVVTPVRPRRMNPTLKGAGALYVNPGRAGRRPRRNPGDPRPIVNKAVAEVMERPPFDVFFMSGSEWNKRGEEETDAPWVIIHDGGDLSLYSGYRETWPAVRKALAAAGWRTERLSHWATALQPATATATAAAAAVKNPGHTGYTRQELWRMYLAALRQGSTNTALTFMDEYLAKGGDAHAADAALRTGGKGMPSKDPASSR